MGAALPYLWLEQAGQCQLFMVIITLHYLLVLKCSTGNLLIVNGLPEKPAAEKVGFLGGCRASYAVDFPFPSKHMTHFAAFVELLSVSSIFIINNTSKFWMHSLFLKKPTSHKYDEQKFLRHMCVINI